MITYPISSNVCKKSFLWDVTGFTIFHLYNFPCFLVSSFTEDFLFVNRIMVKYFLFCSSVDLFDIKYFKKFSNVNLIRKCV